MFVRLLDQFSFTSGGWLKTAYLPFCWTLVLPTKDWVFPHVKKISVSILLGKMPTFPTQFSVVSLDNAALM